MLWEINCGLTAVELTWKEFFLYFPLFCSSFLSSITWLNFSMSPWKFQNCFHPILSSQTKYLDRCVGTHCPESRVTDQDGAWQGCEYLKEQGCAPNPECLQRKDHRCIEESDLNLEKAWDWGETKPKTSVAEKVVSSLTDLCEWWDTSVLFTVRNKV